MGMLSKGKNERDTNKIGLISEYTITTRFLQLGYDVYMPVGGNMRYDMLVEDGEGQFWRIQCKTGWLEEEGTVLKFDTANHNVTGQKRDWRNYRGQCDYFALYNEELNKVYLVPVDQVGTTRAHLRLAPARNNQEKGLRWAKDYEL